MKKWHGAVKVPGSAAGVGRWGFGVHFLQGKAHPIYQTTSQTQVSHQSPSSSTHGISKWDWIKVVFGPIVKKYPAKLRLTALQCFFSCIQSAIWAIAMERNILSWKLSWDLNLLSVAFCGVIVTGAAYWLRVWIIEKKGPVFVATFTPLALIINVIFSSIFWKEGFYWGSACGCVMLVGGLYSVEFMKANETKEEITQTQLEEYADGCTTNKCIRILQSEKSKVISLSEQSND